MFGSAFHEPWKAHRLRRRGRGFFSVVAVAAVGGTSVRASAADAEVHASSVSFDAGRQEVVLEGDVRVDSPPFHLRSEHVRLRRSGGGPLELEGEGTLGFCPCLGTPLAVTFQGAKIAPPGDLFLERPVLSFFGVPVLWLPAFWLRAPSRPGLLPPDLAYRATDGLYTGLGGHLPWHAGQSALDLRGGVYTRGGGTVDARFFGPTSRTHVRLDHLQTTGVFVDARGYQASQAPTSTELSWDVDAVRGSRALAATTRLDEAAKPWDRAAAEGTLSTSGGWSRLSFGALGAMPRGAALGDLGASGPTLGMAIAHASQDGMWRGSVDTFGAAVSDPRGTALSYGTTRAAVEVVGGLGPIVARSTARAEATGTVASDTTAGVGAAFLRTRLGLPLARTFGAARDLVHVVEPFASAGVGARSPGPVPLGLAPLGGDVPDTGSLAASVGARTVLGGAAPSSGALELETSVGGVSLARQQGAPGAFVRITARTHLVGVSTEGAWLFDGLSAESLAYGAGRVRVGAQDGPRLLAHAAFGTARDAFAARRLADTGSDLPAPFLATRTSSVGGRGVLPLARRVSLMAGADADLGERSLLGAFGGIELRDACQCLVLRTFGSRRIGREGADVWLTLDVLGDAPSPPR